MPVRVNSAQYAEKHARRLKAATPDIQAGIERVSVAPTALAAAKKQKMLSNLTEAVNSGKWEAGLRRVSLDEWKNQAVNKGLGRIAAGIDGAQDKVVAFAEKLITYENHILGDVEKMPDLTLEDSINRMTKWARDMAKFTR